MFINIARYSFSPINLRREIRADDFWKYSLNKSELDKLMVEYSNDLARKNYIIDNLKIIQKDSGKNLFILQDLQSNLLVRITNNILSRFINHPIYNREEEIRQLSVLMRTEPQAKIFRTDIKSFFEAINFEESIEKLREDGYNNLPSLKVICSICAFAKTNGHNGLPRGISISSTLANYFMKDFDYAMREIDSCCYYSRYVDDIIVVFTSENINIKDVVIEKLPLGLSLNPEKTQIQIIGNKGTLEYLGYAINLENGDQISIAKNKLNKTKTRICKAIINFNKDLNYSLFFKRLLFLTCNTRMRMSGREKPVIVGYRFSYPLCNRDLVLDQMKSLDKFLHNILNSKNYNPSKKMMGKLTNNQLQEINRLSFYNGYVLSIKTKLTRFEIADIKKAWKYA